VKLTRTAPHADEADPDSAATSEGQLQAPVFETEVPAAFAMHAFE
jgi:hypothetical protein